MESQNMFSENEDAQCSKASISQCVAAQSHGSEVGLWRTSSILWAPHCSSSTEGITPTPTEGLQPLEEKGDTESKQELKPPVIKSHFLFVEVVTCSLLISGAQSKSSSQARLQQKSGNCSEDEQQDTLSNE
ncbi:hypothetical protein Q7C36_016933 [Tachysurus vachellii]|uniref:Uncharacterized protein n=1 Tax=Tachysurus vachellii TaxID=175792 RepID=A0AA88M8H3_TACVA|nr:hypothetical protein Q7C36_016933 [Tachysurus vachellii]